MRFVLRDPSLKHQVVLLFERGRQGDIIVSCNCLATKHPNGQLTHSSLGRTSNIHQTRVLFNAHLSAEDFPLYHMG